MSLKQKIVDDMKQAMKAGDGVKRDTLRMLDSMIKNTEIERLKKEEGLSDGEVEQVISKAVKQRKDSIAQYQAGGRADLAEKEQKEVEILSAYLPEQLGEEEIRKVVKETITALSASKADMGKVMGMTMGKLKGKADGNDVRRVVEEELK